jgi:hypothetical protein
VLLRPLRFGINDVGAVTGEFLDGNQFAYGFLRASDGTFTTFDAPGSGTGSFIGTIPARINAGGVVVGTFYDTNFVLHASYGHWTEQLPYWMLQARAPKGLRGPLRWT